MDCSSQFSTNRYRAHSCFIFKLIFTSFSLYVWSIGNVFRQKKKEKVTRVKLWHYIKRGFSFLCISEYSHSYQTNSDFSIQFFVSIFFHILFESYWTYSHAHFAFFLPSTAHVCATGHRHSRTFSRAKQGKPMPNSKKNWGLISIQPPSVYPFLQRNDISYYISNYIFLIFHIMCRYSTLRNVFKKSVFVLKGFFFFFSRYKRRLL